MLHSQSSCSSNFRNCCIILFLDFVTIVIEFNPVVLINQYHLPLSLVVVYHIGFI